MQGDSDFSSRQGFGATPSSGLVATANYVNPLSGLANDYLNGFNEIITLIEMLPEMPDLVADIQAWRPKSYRAYFEDQAHPAAKAAQIAYDRMNPKLQQDFEAVIAELDRLATGTVAAIRHQLKQGKAPALTDLCARAGQAMRKILKLATNMVNYASPREREDEDTRARRIAAMRAVLANQSAQAAVHAGSGR